MFEAVAQSREDDIREAAELIQGLFTQGTLGRRILAASRALRWGHNRTFEIFIGKAARIDGFEKDMLRAEKLKRQIKEARNEYQQLRARIGQLTAALDLIDATNNGPTINTLEQLVHGLGPVARARDSGASE